MSSRDLQEAILAARKYRVRVSQSPEAKGLPLPSCAYPGEDVGLDLPVCRDTVFPPRSGVDVPTGLRFAIPRGKYLHIYLKGSAARLGLAAELCVVDQGYTGELTHFVWNMSDQAVTIPRGKCVTQGVFRSFDEVTAVLVAEETIDRIPSKRKGGRMNSTKRGI